MLTAFWHHHRSSKVDLKTYYCHNKTAPNWKLLIKQFPNLQLKQGYNEDESTRVCQTEETMALK